MLFLANNAEDAGHILKALECKRLECNMTIALNEPEFNKIIRQLSFDAVLAFKLQPAFSATGILKKLKEQNVHIPFLFIADYLLKDDVVTVMKEGASDCVLKDQLDLLPDAITGAIRKNMLEVQHKQDMNSIVANEAMLSAAARLAHLGSWKTDLVNNTERWSDEQYRILGLTPAETEPPLENFIRKVHPEDVISVTQIISEAIKELDKQKFECRIINNEGHVKYISAEMAIKRDINGKPLLINGCIWDISEARVAELNEKRIMSDLVQHNKDLEQFAYIISHNLRAPVANIIGVSNTLFEGNLDKDEEHEFMEALSDSVKKLDSIITDLNQILQVKRHVNEYMEQVNFAQLVDEIKSSIGVFLEEQCIMILSDFEEAQEMLTLKSYMRSIFYNLISNSIKYRKPDLAPVIEIKSRKDKDKIGITFKDNCIGIDLKKKKDQMFGLYNRFHPDHADGKGMGLFMVKTQVETLGGKISVESKVNEGTEFKIEFGLQNVINSI